MKDFEQKREGIEGERIKEITENKLKAIQLLYGMEIKLKGCCLSCRREYDLTDCLLGRDNGVATFAKSCVSVNGNKDRKRAKILLDSSKCWQELKYEIFFRNKLQEEFSKCDYYKVAILRSKIIGHKDNDLDKIRQKDLGLYLSVILNYGNFTDAFHDAGYKKNFKLPNWRELLQKMSPELSDRYISWILGVETNTVKRLRKLKKTTD